MKVSKRLMLIILLAALGVTLSGVFFTRGEYVAFSLMQGIIVASVSGLIVQVYRPIRKLEAEAEAVWDGHESRPMEQNLIQYITGLIRDNQAITEKEYELQVLIKQAELNALQSQINPHFLYNTLDSIRGYALRQDMDEIADMTEALSTYFRYSISNSGAVVTLADELENIENYMLIQRFRFGDRVELQVSLEEEQLGECRIPKMTLQPVVENAVLHGLESTGRRGLVTVQIRAVYEELEIRIADNGVGMDDEALRDINYRLNHPERQPVQKGNHSGIALPNVCQRIKLFFGEEYGMHVFSTPDIGTEMLILIPAVYQDAQSDLQKERGGRI